MAAGKSEGRRVAEELGVLLDRVRDGEDPAERVRIARQARKAATTLVGLAEIETKVAVQVMNALAHAETMTPANEAEQVLAERRAEVTA